MARCRPPTWRQPTGEAAYASRQTDGTVPDHWPPAWPRRIALHVAQMQVALDACRDQGLLAVLPWPVAARAGLRRLPLAGIEGSPLHLVQRPALDRATRADRVAQAIQAWTAESLQS